MANEDMDDTLAEDFDSTTEPVTDSDVPTTATAQQYAICKVIYDEEKERFAAIGVKANVYITLSGVLLGAVLFRLSDLKASFALMYVPIDWELFVVIALLTALGFALFSLLVRAYQPYQDLYVIAAEIAAGIDDNAFYTERIADMAVAVEENTKLNDGAAEAVYRCQLSMFVAVAIQAIIVVVGFFRMIYRHRAW